MTYYVHCLQVGRNDNLCITHAHAWREGQPATYFGGDAYWSWMFQPGYVYRNHATGFCWAQALFCGLNGPHQEAFLSEVEFRVDPTDSDYDHVVNMVELCQNGPDVP